MRIAGLGLVVTRDGGIPLTWHAYPGDRPDVTQFATMTGQLARQYEATAAAAGGGAADMTVVSGAGQTHRTISPTWPGPACTTWGQSRRRTART